MAPHKLTVYEFGLGLKIFCHEACLHVVFLQIHEV